MSMVFLNIINCGGGGLGTKSCPTLCNPMDCNRQAPLFMGFSRQEYRMGCHLLLQGIFLTQGLNPGLLHCRQILYQATREAHNKYCCHCSVAYSCLTLCDPMNCSTPGFPVLHHILESSQAHVHELIMPCNHLILFSSCSQSFPASESFPMTQHLHIWPKYWSFSFSISPSN